MNAPNCFSEHDFQINGSQRNGLTQKRIGFLLAAFLFCFTPASADWPVYRGNLQRTNFVDQEIEARHWEPVWQHHSLSPPTPAWPAPAKGSLWQQLSHIEPRVTDDVADAPLIASDKNAALHVLISSSANDRLVSLDPNTGDIQWQYVTDAPIRYAPSILDGVVYLGADDGRVRAISLTKGTEIWSVNVGPEMPWIIGNGRLISPHPIRTSVMADEKYVYATAGLFPSQSVYLVALDRTTGVIAWRRKTDRSPQGYLLATADNKVYIPTGRATPFAVDAKNGKTLFDLPSPGGSFCMLTAEAFFAGPGNTASVQAQPTGAGAKMLSFGGRQVVAGGANIWSANGKQLTCLTAAALKTGDLTPVWSVECKLDAALMGSGTVTQPIIFAAKDATIEIYDGSDGKRLQTLFLPKENLTDQIKHLAVTVSQGDAPELLIATTASGIVYAWRGVIKSARSEWPTLDRGAAPPSLANPETDVRVEFIVAALPVNRGWVLVLGDDNGSLASSFLGKTPLHVVSLVADPAARENLQAVFQQQHVYGHRVTVLACDSATPFPFAPGLFNVVVEATSSDRTESELLAMLTDKIGVLSRAKITEPKIKSALPDAGAWRHQYATSANTADSGDPYVGSAVGFRLQWFGGVGPSRMPDRHLRGPAPLAAGAVLIIQGDGVLIGVDPANGTERWELELPPGAMRYVTPFDAGYASLSENGEELFVAAGPELWQINAYTGEKTNRIKVPVGVGKLHWGYVAQVGDAIYTTGMKSTAPRTAQDNKIRYTFVNNDYNSDRPLVTGRSLTKLNLNGKLQWAYGGDGLIVHGSLAINEDQQRMIFVEGRSADCLQHETDQVPLSTLMQDARMVCLNTETGKIEWEKSLQWTEAKNMIYGQMVDDKIVLTSSESNDGKADYAMRVFAVLDGTEIWNAKHRHVRAGLFHGEQVHHPVVLKNLDGSKVLVAEPYLYDLSNGKRIVPAGAPEDWALVRPGHSCGTLSGTGHCLFFRAGNPTVLDLSQSDGKAYTALAPSRTSCWINMIPAGGRLLIPEGSASCVCNYSIQTSMAFVPLKAAELETALPGLPDIEPVD